MTPNATVAATSLPLPRIRTGKVRDVYAVGDDRVLLVATDRVSAFDVVMGEAIPSKGAVLTQLTAWWLMHLADGVAHHMITAEVSKKIPTGRLRGNRSYQWRRCARFTPSPVMPP